MHALVKESIKVAKQLWAKGDAINSVMHRLTVGDDPVLDLQLVRFDCIESAAHARMLSTIGVLSKEECRKLLGELKEILLLSEKGTFEIPHELEDAHTAIESHLGEKLGDTGKKIHTGRSRNDQVIVTLRLFMRDLTLQWISQLLKTSTILLNRYEEAKNIPMPGYTHFQPAMPSSVGMWLHAFGESLLAAAQEGFRVYDYLDSNPLGAAAGFGSGLPLDRQLTANLLGFSRVQRSFIDIQNSRGRMEERLLFWATEIASIFEKFAFDIVLSCSSEFGFFSLPVDLTTGSSIMPQKRNPDLAELLRARAGQIRAAFNEVSLVTAKLPSSYHRDLQLTKGPLMRAVSGIAACFESAQLLATGLRFNSDRLASAMTPELYATYEAYRLVKEGAPFRVAYQETAKLVKEGKIEPDKLRPFYETVLKETESCVLQARTDANALSEKHAHMRQQLSAVEEKVFVP